MSSTGAPVRRPDRFHPLEYGAEALGLGLFMLSAAVFATLLGHPGSPLHPGWAHPWMVRAPMGLAMGATAVALIYSPFGQRSGAHLNPATTLAFYRLGKIHGRDAVAYGVAQFAGGLLGIALGRLILGRALADPAVDYVTTRPGSHGVAVAFVAEAAMTFLLMFLVLVVSNSRWARLTGGCAGLLVMLYITFEAPLSGMSMNPARTFASAFAAGDLAFLWLYFTAPPLGMLLAAEIFVRSRRETICAKLHHTHRYPCIFRCGYMSSP